MGDLVTVNGELAILVTVSVAAYDAYDTLDADNSTFAAEAVRMIVAGLTEKDARRLAGRGLDATFRATFPDSVTVRADRAGRCDHILRLPGIDSLSIDEDTATIDGEEYTLAYAAGTTAITGYEDDYTEYIVVDTRLATNPFSPLSKLNTAYLQSVGT
jgi:hypothetical protein